MDGDNGDCRSKIRCGPTCDRAPSEERDLSERQQMRVDYVFMSALSNARTCALSFARVCRPSLAVELELPSAFDHEAFIRGCIGIGLAGLVSQEGPIRHGQH